MNKNKNNNNNKVSYNYNNINKIQRVLSVFMILTLVLNMYHNIIAVSFNPNESEDEETNKEYTAKLLDLQFNTIMALSLDYDLDDEFGITTDTTITLLGSVQINHNNNSNIEVLKEEPQINLVDENNNIVATTESYRMDETSDIYYLTIYDINVENDKQYKLLATFTDNYNNEISKYITYSDELMISTDGTNYINYKSVNNMASITFTLEENIIKGDLNGDSKVNAIDSAMVLDIYKQNADSISAQELMYEDMNNDGKVNSIDAAMILDSYKENN